MGKLFWSGVTSQGSGQGPSCRTEDSGRQLQIYTHVLQRRRMASDCWDSGSVGALLNRDTDPRWWWCLLLSRQKAQPVICSTTRTAELEHKESSHIIQIKLVSIHMFVAVDAGIEFSEVKKATKAGKSVVRSDNNLCFRCQLRRTFYGMCSISSHLWPWGSICCLSPFLRLPMQIYGRAGSLLRHITSPKMGYPHFFALKYEHWPCVNDFSLTGVSV